MVCSNLKQNISLNFCPKYLSIGMGYSKPYSMLEEQRRIKQGMAKMAPMVIHRPHKLLTGPLDFISHLAGFLVEESSSLH